jgi:mono/diheme cytochrome c family protein
VAQSAVERGQDIATRLCGHCHGIGNADVSPHHTAPAFRRLGTRVDLDELEQRLRQGILAGHPEMPAFVLKHEEARAMVAYLRAIRTD